jgi:hypothetical protein
MRYLITTNTHEPFLSDYFDAENCFNASDGMVVYDLESNEFTIDGIKWKLISEDHL